MTFVSVADACRRLGIDAKTLHRWLAEAQLSLSRHPGDGRKKGVSDEHLELLARRHQRSLASLPPAPVPGELPTLPTALLALPERLDALQSQIVALQQQVTALTHLLQQQHEPALPAAALLSRRSKRSPKPAPAAPRARPAAKPPRKPVHVIPRVEYGSEGHYVVICPKGGLLPFEPETPEWFAWLAEQSSFRFVGRPDPGIDPCGVGAGGGGTASSPDVAACLVGILGVVASLAQRSATVVDPGVSIPHSGLAPFRRKASLLVICAMRCFNPSFGLSAIPTLRPNYPP